MFHTEPTQQRRHVKSAISFVSFAISLFHPWRPMTSAFGPMSRNDPDRQYLPAMKNMWDTVERLWKPAHVLTEAGHHFCQTWAARAAHPDFPYALHMLALMCPLTNGGRASIFPTSPSPLVAFTMNCNYAQTRKSSMTSHSDQTMKPLDDLVRQRVQNQLAAGGHLSARLATKKTYALMYC